KPPIACDPFTRIVIRQEDVVYMNEHSAGQPGENAQVFDKDIPSHPQDVRRVDKEDVAIGQGAKEGGINVLNFGSNDVIHPKFFEPGILIWLDADMFRMASFSSVAIKSCLGHERRVARADLEHCLRFEVTDHTVQYFSVRRHIISVVVEESKVIDGRVRRE